MLKTVRRYVLALSAAVIGFLASFGAQEANAQYCYPGSFGSCVGYDYNTAVFKVTLGALILYYATVSNYWWLTYYAYT